jgi:metallophosphoesterase superfamily enzyme
VKKYVALYDLHYGFERKNRHKVPLHDVKAVGAVLAFVRDFKPDVLILGGDALDCGAISHHNHGRPGRVEGLRIIADARMLRHEVLSELEKHCKELVYIVGNHEAWLEDLMEREPGIEEILDLKALLSLGPKWKIVPQGGHYKLGKLIFIHGDQLRSNEYCAKYATLAYQKNVRFGHFHTYQAYTMTSACDTDMGRTGIAVPCLCRKDPSYGNSAPNKWVQGFNYGYVWENGNFNDYTPIIVNGEFMVNGKMYGG